MAAIFQARLAGDANRSWRPTNSVHRVTSERLLFLAVPAAFRSFYHHSQMRRPLACGAMRLDPEFGRVRFPANPRAFFLERAS